MILVILVVVAATSGDPLIDWLSRAGALGILAAGVIGFLRGWIVTGRENTRVLQERDRAIELVYRQAEATNRALEVAEKTKGGEQ